MTTPTLDEATLRRLRLLLKDPNKAAFSDTDLADFWDVEGGGLKRAGALALETIAQDTARVLQYVETTGLKTNGKTAAEAVLLVADRWRTQAATERAEQISAGASSFAEVRLVC